MPDGVVNKLNIAAILLFLIESGQITVEQFRELQARCVEAAEE